MRRRVVVTGLGTINPLGIGVVDSWDNVKKNKCGIDYITRFDTTDFNVKLAGEVKNFVPEDYIDKKEARRMDRFIQFAVASSYEAVKDSGLDLTKEDSYRCGVIISSGIGGLQVIEKEHSRGLARGFEKVSPLFVPTAIVNMAAGQVAIQLGIHGMSSCPVTACAGGTNAIGDGFHYIRDGYGDIMICGGTESCISELGIGGFASMKALNATEDKNRASIPFDKERNGFVMGEGSGILVLEEYEHAVKRGAYIYCEIAGYGATCDAYHITSPCPDGEGGAACMAMAVNDAGLRPDDVDYINAHGTSTHLNDLCETMAIHRTFGEHAEKLKVSSTKSMTGHLLGGSGGVEAVFSVMAIKEGYVPATINYRVPDEQCDLDIVPNEGRHADIKTVISNSLGFGGHNASILFRKMEA